MVLEANVKNTMDCKENKCRSMEEAGLTRSLVNRIRKQQATFVGHILRRKGLEHFVITGKMEGRRRGRQREQMIDSLAAWMDISIDKTASTISAATNRAVWKEIIANALGQGRAPKKKKNDHKKVACTKEVQDTKFSRYL